MNKLEKTKRIIIGNNNIIKSLTCEYGTCGAGGSNTSSDKVAYDTYSYIRISIK